MKHKVDQDTSSAMTMGTLPYTTSGYIETVTDVYQSLVLHFQNGEHRDRKQSRNGFNAWRFSLYTNKSNPVQRPEESITALKGISNNYQFVVRNVGVLFIRRRVCYCLSCVASMQHNFTEWNGDTHVIPGCCMSALGSEKSSNLYTFDKSHCERTHGPNVTKQLQQDERDGEKWQHH